MKTVAELTRELIPAEKLEQLNRWETIQNQVKVAEDKVTAAQAELAAVRATCQHEVKDADGKCSICGQG